MGSWMQNIQQAVALSLNMTLFTLKGVGQTRIR